MAAILDLRQNLRWPRSIFQIVWSKVHESTEKTLTGKGQFLPGSDLTITVVCAESPASPLCAACNYLLIGRLYSQYSDVEIG